MPATAATTAPLASVLSSAFVTPVMAKVVEVAWVSSVFPVSVVDAMSAERVAFSCPPTLRTPETVDEPVTASAEVVAAVADHCLAI